MDFETFQRELKSKTYEERAEYEHSLSGNYIERHGELANTLRLCMNIDYNATSSESLWIDDEFRKTNVRYLDIERYNDWIAT